MGEYRNNQEVRMSMLASDLRRKIEAVIGALESGTELPSQLEVADRRIFVFSGEDAKQQADEAHKQYIEGGKVPVCGIEQHDGTWYFVA